MTNSAAHPIGPHSLITLNYRLSGPSGDFVNTFTMAPATLTLGTGTLSPALESTLIGLTEDTHHTFSLASGQAFGDPNPDLRQWVTHAMLRELGEASSNYSVGEIVQFPTPNGVDTFSGVVIHLAADDSPLSVEVPAKRPDDAAFLADFNHPLSGLPVEFEVQIIGVCE